MERKKWAEYCERQRYTNTKEYLIETYGETEGTSRYLDICDKRMLGFHIASLHKQSNISLELFDELIKQFKNNIIYYYNNEYTVSTDRGKYSVDYYDETYNVVIEFYGTYWHMDPEKYVDTYIMYNGSTANEKRERDRKRLEAIQEKLNCKIIVVWESTYRDDAYATIDYLTDLIDDHNNLENITYI